jgi:hypothetical protein
VQYNTVLFSEINWRFDETHCLQHHGRNLSQARNKHEEGDISPKR